MRVALFLFFVAGLCGQSPQNPSPMVEHTRKHERLNEQVARGERRQLALGVLYLPPRLKQSSTPLLIHFHGPRWIAEIAGGQAGGAVVIAVDSGAGSSVYAEPFRDGEFFTELLREAEQKAGTRFSPITISSWSAGYGAVREILRRPEHYARVDRYVAIDSIHAGYVSGKPGPAESELVAADLDVFLQFAKDAVAGRKQMLLTHSEIFPGTFASTTEVADFLLRGVGLTRKPVVKWGPLGMQLLSETTAGKLTVLGYAGNSAPDHVDQLHAMPEIFRLLK
ncbi:MAG: hypothetical protein JJE04_03195 [Acidobacteriia bacterium]|nr:hypothetical protein [Terriglobia bacterium]